MELADFTQFLVSSPLLSRPSDVVSGQGTSELVRAIRNSSGKALEELAHRPLSYEWKVLLDQSSKPQQPGAPVTKFSQELNEFGAFSSVQVRGLLCTGEAIEIVNGIHSQFAEELTFCSLDIL